MKRTKEVEQIIRHGSVKQKIRLYMADIALLNVDPDNLELTDSGDIKGSTLLSAEEREYLYQSVKTTKDIEYYEKLRKLNSVFLFFKERAIVDIMKLKITYYQLCVTDAKIEAAYNEVALINKLLDLYPPRQRGTGLKTAIKEMKPFGGVIREGRIEIAPEEYYAHMKHTVEIAKDRAMTCVATIAYFKRILSRDLPLQPYRDWVKDADKKIKDIMKSIYLITTGDERYPKNYPQFPKYEDIEITIKEEDIEDFKNSQL